MKTSSKNHRPFIKVQHKRAIYFITNMKVFKQKYNGQVYGQVTSNKNKAQGLLKNT